MYRVAVAELGRGPLNPRFRPDDPAVDRRDWNRFDTPGLTVYGADQRATAFTESIAYKAPSARDYAGLAEEAAFLGIGLAELLDELRAAGAPVDGMGPDWRLSREIYTLEFAPRAWVDLAHPDTVSAVKASGIADADRLSLADLTGDDRAVTTRVAQWLRAQRLDTGTGPAGVRYPSKFGFAEDDYCWAAFLDRADGPGCTVRGEAFSAWDPDLCTAVHRTGVSVS
jgi:hypothetical protein